MQTPAASVPVSIDPDSRLRARYGGDAVIVFRRLAGLDWGWYTREDPRMHLQTVSETAAGSHKVWLERDGRRVFEPEGRAPAKILTALEKQVLAHSASVEAQWANFMMEKGWLDATLLGRQVHLRAYPGTSGEFRRVIDIDQELPGLRDLALTPPDVRLDTEHAALMLLASRGDRSPRVFLPEVLWTGTRGR